MSAVTSYSGTHAGQTISSLYPHLFRVEYRSVIGTREYHTDTVIPAIDEHHARERVNAKCRSGLRGSITVTQVGSLTRDH